jgi:hypothetical protein
VLFVFLCLSGKPVGISTQDRLMSTSFRYEINRGKPDNSAIRMQKVAEVNRINCFNKISNNEVHLFSKIGMKNYI